MKEEQHDSENRQLTEHVKKLSGFSGELNTLVNMLQTNIKKLEGEKEALQNEVQIAKTKVCICFRQSVSLPMYIYVLYIWLPIYLSIYLSIYLPIYLLST